MKFEISNLSYSYSENSVKVIDNLNMKIKDGQIVLLLGLNGCGKTTLIKNMAGLLKPLSGSIKIDGIDIFDMSVRERSKHISYVPQKINNQDDVVIKDYLTFGFTNKLKFYEKPKAEHIKKVEEYAEKFHIKHLLSKTLDEISGGEKQIVSICCALLQNTEIILLDEPTSALDLKNQNMVLSILVNIAKEENKTIILSSHNPNHGLYLNSEVALMKSGAIIKNGIASEIINPEILRDVYGENICYSNELSYKEVSFK